jgi:hypothetical protein
MIHRIVAVVAAISLATFAGTALAKHQHHDGQKILGNKINSNGKHELHKVGEHTVHVQVADKKVVGVTVTHRTKGNVAVKKYKTSKKVVQITDFRIAAGDLNSLVQPATYKLAQTILYIGYSFTDGIDEYIYWFPVEMVVDPYTGAVEYIPLA